MASRIDTSAVHLGIGVLEVGEYNTAGTFLGYRDVGVIKGTLSIEMTREVKDFETGRPLQPVKSEVVRETGTVTFTMSEIRVANLKMAIGGGVVTSSVTPPAFLDGTFVAPDGSLTTSVVTVGLSDTFTLGGQCDLTTMGLRFTHQKSCTTGKRQIVEMFKVQSQGQLAMPFSEEDWLAFEVSFRLQADTVRPAGAQQLRFIDERN